MHALCALSHCDDYYSLIKNASVTQFSSSCHLSINAKQSKM